MSRPSCTVAELADRWQVTTTTIYSLIYRGELRAWRLGGKLWRINLDAIGEYECRDTPSDASAAPVETAASTATMSCTGETMPDRTVYRLARMTARPQRLSLVTSGQSGRL
jgi:excisionase family DNA binding protein